MEGGCIWREGERERVGGGREGWEEGEGGGEREARKDIGRE